ncbi:hypothetical protein BDV34DRAFT_133316 [Aspergillus parasiticus]|uniref:Uncharacterized protein n=1 Tax=Aspergillus parasiticus TaxID=5067 RepID=A0A5N6DG41_ASPPA|nr:hypothetical protein BDV34DRAFT_133316 [Aspergillus parasiticus]
MDDVDDPRRAANEMNERGSPHSPIKLTPPNQKVARTKKNVGRAKTLGSGFRLFHVE